MASSAQQLNAELQVARLEAVISAAVTEWTDAQLAAHVDGAAEPPVPAVMRSQRTLSALAGCATRSLRAHQLLGLCRRALVDAAGGPRDVAEALALDGVPAPIHAWARARARGLERAEIALDPQLRSLITERLRRRSAVAAGRRELCAAGVDLSGVRWFTPAAVGNRRPRTYLISPPANVAVVVTAEPSLASWRQVWHELGHAAFACGHDPSQPWSLRDAPSPVVHEAFAELFAGRIDDADVLAALLEVDTSTAESIATWRAYRRQCWRRQLLADDVPPHYARYLVADALAGALRSRLGPRTADIVDAITAAAWLGARYEWHELAGQ